MNNLMRIAVLILGIIVIFNFVLFIFGASPFNRTTRAQEHVISAGSITAIQIVSTTGHVIVSPSESDKIRVQLDGGTLSKNYQLKVKEKNNKLSIHAKKKKSFLSFNKAPLDFTLNVELPVKQYERLYIQTDVANIDVHQVQASKFELETDVGNIYVSGGQGTLHANADVGHITLQVQNILYDMTAKTRVGDISVATMEVPTALQIQLEHLIGNETVELPGVKKGAIGKGGPLVKLTTEVGNVELVMAGE